MSIGAYLQSSSLKRIFLPQNPCKGKPALNDHSLSCFPFVQIFGLSCSNCQVHLPHENEGLEAVHNDTDLLGHCICGIKKEIFLLDVSETSDNFPTFMHPSSIVLLKDGNVDLTPSASDAYYFIRVCG